MIIKVYTYSGYKSDENPREFILGGNKLKVIEIIDRWRDPECNYFRVRTQDNALYILKHDLNTDLWEIVFYRSEKDITERTTV